MSKIRFGIVGTNFISDWFADALANLSDCEISAVYSRATDTGNAFATRHGIPSVYTSYTDMLKSDIDAVYIASPTFMHGEQAVIAMNMGKHVLCEKMMAHSYKSALDMIEASGKSGRVLLEATRPLFDPSFELIKEGIKKLGRIHRVHLGYSQYSSRYDRFKEGEVLNAFNPEIANSALADIGIYPLELCIALFGKPSSVKSSGVFLDNGFLASGEIMLDYDGMIASITYSKIQDEFVPSVIEGELGSLIIDGVNKTSSITLALRGRDRVVVPYERRANNMNYEIEAFLEMLRGNKDNAPYLLVSEEAHRIVSLVYSQTGADRYIKI